MTVHEFITRVETDKVLFPSVREVERWIKNIDTLIYTVKNNHELDPTEKLSKLSKLRLIKASYETIKDCL